MQRYAIQLGERELYAASGPDWAPLGAKTVTFETRPEAEQYRRDYCHEPEARVVRVWVGN